MTLKSEDCPFPDARTGDVLSFPRIAQNHHIHTVTMGEHNASDMQDQTGPRSLTRQEILHQIRGEQESRHRQRVWMQSVRTPLTPDGDKIASRLPEIEVDDVADFCNKTLPLYIFPVPTSKAHLANGQGLLLIVVHNYIYRKWFRPYRSEIEWDRFITKVIVPPRQVDSCDPLTSVHIATSMNARICAQIKARLSSTPRPVEQHMAAEHEEYIDTDVYKLQSLFHAVAIIIRGEDYSNLIQDIGQLPVSIVLTGLQDPENPLSAPITFEHIASKVHAYNGTPDQVARTTLETAIEFVMDLEEREITATGLRPDPYRTTQNRPDGGLTAPVYFDMQARDLGWGNEPLMGPSSEWVDVMQYPEWSGDGADGDAGCMQLREKQALRWQAHLDSLID